MKVNGYDCEVNAKVSVSDLQELSGKDGERVVGFTSTFPRAIYVAIDSVDRASTFFHELLHQVIFTTPALKKKLRSYNDDEEKYVEMIEQGMVKAYESYGHQLPDPAEKRRWRFRD